MPVPGQVLPTFRQPNRNEERRRRWLRGLTVLLYESYSSREQPSSHDADCVFSHISHMAPSQLRHARTRRSWLGCIFASVCHTHATCMCVPD